MEIIVGEYYYHRMMYQRFQLLALDDNMAWLKSEDHYLTTTIDELVVEKKPLPLPENGVK